MSESFFENGLESSESLSEYLERSMQEMEPEKAATFREELEALNTLLSFPRSVDVFFESEQD